MKVPILYLGLAFSIFAFSCEEDQVVKDEILDSLQVLDPIYFISDSVYQARVDIFIAAAEERGVLIDTSNLIIVNDSTLDINTPSLFTFEPDTSLRIQKKLIINPNRPIGQNEYETDAWWFHMLGHLLLNRDHDNSYLPDNKHPKSLMIENNLGVMGPCTYAISNNNSCNHVNKRPYYLDELFNPNTPAPVWAL